MKKKKMFECINCGAELDPELDFIVDSVKDNVVLCMDCYDMPLWYELINQ